MAEADAPPNENDPFEQDAATVSRRLLAGRTDLDDVDTYGAIRFLLLSEYEPGDIGLDLVLHTAAYLEEQLANQQPDPDAKAKIIRELKRKALVDALIQLPDAKDLKSLYDVYILGIFNTLENRRATEQEVEMAIENLDRIVLYLEENMPKIKDKDLKILKVRRQIAKVKGAYHSADGNKRIAANTAARDLKPLLKEICTQ